MTANTIVRSASDTRCRPPTSRGGWTGHVHVGTSVALLGLAAVVLLPVGMLVLRAWSATWFYPALFPSDGSAETVGKLLRDARLWHAALTSGTLAATAGGVAAGLGLGAARGLARAAPRVRALGAALAFLPVIAPPIALGVGLQVVTLQAHVANTWAGVLFSHVVPATGYATLYFLGVLTAYDWRIEDDARTLGAAPWTAFRRVAVPMLRRRIVEAAVLAALVSWTQLALTLVVGGGAVRTLPLELLAFVNAGDDRLAAAAALVLTVPPALAVGLLSLGARRTGMAP